MKKNKSVERKKLLLFHFILNQLKFHVVVQWVQEVDHVVVLVVSVIDQVGMINNDVKNFHFYVR
jgi:hypothetical protein